MQVAALKELLEKSGIAHKRISIIAGIRVHIHVETYSREAAEQWADLLGKVTGNKIKCFESNLDSESSWRKKVKPFWKIYGVI